MKIDLSTLQNNFKLENVNQNSDTKLDLDLKINDLGTTKESTKHDLATNQGCNSILCCRTMGC